MTNTSKAIKVPKAGMYLLGALRIVIGWHLLHEGLSKLGDPTWTAAGYLNNSRGIFAGIFQSLAANPGVVEIIDFLNIWGLILIGLGLFLGFLTKIAQYTGMVLLALYYLSNPPFVGNPGYGMEGQYLFVDKNLVEFTALLVLSFFPTGKFLGIDGLIRVLRGKIPDLHVISGAEKSGLKASESRPEEVASLKRREVLKHLATLPILGGFAFAYLKKRQWQSVEEATLVDALSGASVKKFEFPVLDELKGTLPKGRIKDKEFSKLILGGNLLNGWAHSRDLIYVSSLVRAYHTRERIFSTMAFAEKCGVDTVLTHPVLATLINQYWDQGMGNIQFISDCTGLTYENGPQAMPFNEYLDLIQTAIDKGATACYIQGETADYYFENGLYDEVAKAMDLIRDAKIPVGIGAHRIETIKKAVELGFEVDFWMKTLHHQEYWSAKHETWNDNKYCFNTKETIQFMEKLPEPWIAFKVLAAGAIHPGEAFRFAYENGADFVCAGMYDFQMVEDVNIALNNLGEDLPRSRPWRA